MDLLRWTIAFLCVSALAILVGGVLWNLGERALRQGDKRLEMQGLARLGRFLVIDAGLVLGASVVCYVIYRMPAG